MLNERLRILFIGDVFSDVGRRVLAENLKQLKTDEEVDFCIVNGENCAGGRGITRPLAKKLHAYGADVITGGNHSLANADGLSVHENDPHLLRPLNLPPHNVGRGSVLVEIAPGVKIAVVNLMGRIFFHETYDCPFRLGLQAIETLYAQTPLIFVDFHAEATSEKIAFAAHVDGLTSAVIGTHTHVQTADERILRNGTAFLSDAGMTGPEDSIIGMKKESVIKKFLLQTYERFEPSHTGPMLNGVIVDVDPKNGKALNIRRIFHRVTFKPQASDDD